MKTTLNKIREHNPCTGGWEKLLKYLGKTKADDEPLAITTILDSNGVDDAIWCLRAVEGYDREIRLYAVWCARQVQHLLTDQRSLEAIDVAERYANGEATQDELNAARAAAWDAARAAACAAAGDTARAAARAAEAPAMTTRAAAEAAWWAAAAEDAAAGDTARAAARAAEAPAMTTRAAADAADAAARHAAWAAWAAAAEDAAAEDATRAKQEAELRRICGEG